MRGFDTATQIYFTEGRSIWSVQKVRDRLFSHKLAGNFFTILFHLMSQTSSFAKAPLYGTLFSQKNNFATAQPPHLHVIRHAVPDGVVQVVHIRLGDQARHPADLQHLRDALEFPPLQANQYRLTMTGFRAPNCKVQRPFIRTRKELQGHRREGGPALTPSQPLARNQFPPTILCCWHKFVPFLLQTVFQLRNTHP